MAEQTGIEWCTATWPVVQGCTVVSPGCANCYAVNQVNRQMRHPNRKLSVPLKGCVEKHKGRNRFTGKVALRDDRLDWPLKWKEPKFIFVPSHGDLFHEDVPDYFIDQVLAVMACCPQHTFQVLTKRPERMREYLTAPDLRERLVPHITELAFAESDPYARRVDDLRATAPDIEYDDDEWPLPNVWLGVSVEDQQRADERIPLLLATPAAKRFVSAEPLLGAVDLTHIVDREREKFPWLSFDPTLDALTGNYPLLEGFPREPHPRRINWVIVGGESGKDARPMHPDWVRALRDQCAGAEVPIFFKQWGEWGDPESIAHTGITRPGWWEPNISDGGVEICEWQGPMKNGVEIRALRPTVYRVGKKAAGNLLDGRKHEEMPA